MLGCLQLIVMLSQYLIGPDSFASFTFLMIMFAVNTGLIVYIGIRYRKMNDNVLIFKDAFNVVFMTMLISTGISVLGQIVLFHVIDPELPKQIQEIMLQKTIGFMEKFGVPQEEIDKAVDDMNNRMDEYSVINMLKGFLWYSVIGAVMALIIAAIIKKNPDPFTEDSQGAA